MNKIVTFLVGVILLVVVFIAMFFTGAIFDASNRQTVETYFFQGNNFSYQRPGLPQTPQQMGDSQLFNLLTQKYVTEYLYVLPDVADINHRETTFGPLNTMSNPMTDTFDKWKKDVAPEIRKMADAGMMRTVAVGTPLKYGDFYQVEFELTTWQHPNDMDEAPKTTAGTMQFKVMNVQNMIITDNLNELHRYIEAGFDPVVVFRFKVSDVTIHME